VTRRRLPVNTTNAFPRRRGGGAGEPAAHPVPPPSNLEISDGSLLIDSRELARLLGIGRTKAFELMARGEVPVVRIGRCVRVSRAALQTWVAKRAHHDNWTTG